MRSSVGRPKSDAGLIMLCSARLEEGESDDLRIVIVSNIAAFCDERMEYEEPIAKYVVSLSCSSEIRREVCFFAMMLVFVSQFNEPQLLCVARLKMDSSQANVASQCYTD